MRKKPLIAAALWLALVPAAPYADERSDRTVLSDSNLLIRLETSLNTRSNRTGDSFTATVLEPEGYEGSMIRGHIRTIDQSGRIKGRTEMSLAFDTIRLPGKSAQPFQAELIRVRESESVKVVDNEGRIISGSRTNQTLTRSGIGAAVGGVLGGVLGGGKGALLGVLLGGGVGAGSVYAEGAKEIRLDRGTEMDIQTKSSSSPSAQARSDYDRDDASTARTDFERDPRFVQDIQNALSKGGYDPGARDGRLGWKTREALRSFQLDKGLPVTGTIDEMTADRLGIHR